MTRSTLDWLRLCVGLLSSSISRMASIILVGDFTLLGANRSEEVKFDDTKHARGNLTLRYRRHIRSGLGGDIDQKTTLYASMAPCLKGRVGIMK